MKTYDLIVLGGGGASAMAKRAGAAGLNTALIEPGPLGGTCPNRGCIPSKILLEHAAAAEAVRKAGRLHMKASLGRIDTARILAETRKKVSGTDAAIKGSFGKRVTVFREQGEFLDPFTVRAGRAVIRAKKIVVSTGTRPVRPVSPAGVEKLRYYVSDDIFKLKAAPRSMAISGGGYIACEFAHFFAGIGAKVTLVQRGPELLSGEDEDVRKVVTEAFKARAVVRLRSTVEKVDRRNGAFRLQLKGVGAATVSSEALFYAIGRRPNTDAIGIENTGVKLDSRGFVSVNDYVETSVKCIFAVGDVNGRHLFTHAANVQNELLADRLSGGPRVPLDHGPMPHAIFTDPEVAGVGETEEALRARGKKCLKAVVRYDELARGIALKEEHGLAKLLANPAGEILGFHAVGPEASVLLHQVVVAMRWRKYVSSLTGAITVHPSLNEIVAETAWRLLDLLPRGARRGPGR